MSSSSAHSGELLIDGQSKVERYRWTTKDRKGEFQYISKSSLKLDREHYQREPYAQKVLEMARDWSWVACGALSVALRVGGDDAGYWVMDGQYRLLAATRRSDIQDLPCMVFRVHDIQEEARGFINVNTLRKAMKVNDQFKAMVTAGDERALFVKDLVEGVGRTFDHSKSRNVTCVGELLRMSKDDGTRERLINVWPVLDKVCGENSVSIVLLKGFMFLESKMLPGESLTHGRWHRRVIEVGMHDLVVAGRKAAQYHGKGSAMIFAGGMLERMNKKTHVSKRYKLNVVLSSAEGHVAYRKVNDDDE